MGFLKYLVLLELFPVVVAISLWGESFHNKKVCLHCDNLGVVQDINSLSGSSPTSYTSFAISGFVLSSRNVFLYPVHILGVENTLAHTLSHFQLDRFRELAHGTEQHGTPCPLQLWRIALESPLV